MKRIGIYSGTFDPIHPGHLAFAVESMRVCRLDEVVLLPEQEPRGKQAVTDIAHRIALVECATAPIAGLRVQRLASRRFTVEETMPELRQLFGSAHFTFLLGSDTLPTLHLWRGIDSLLGESSLAIGLRHHDEPEDVARCMRRLARMYAVPARYDCIVTTETNLRSSDFRSGVADRSRLHPDLLAYIQEHQLYRLN